MDLSYMKSLQMEGQGQGLKAFSFFFFSFLFFFFFLSFLGPLSWHMEVPRLGVESEL